VKRPLAPTQPPRNARASARASARTPGAHPLLAPFPLVVMALALLLVLFTLTMAQLKAGADPDLARGTSSALVAKAPVRTP
jgi:hypothetical protein